ncbi:protein EARLY FLOWERING 3-like [Andrographis paniculata]|uniref:protein EARLY FLOWERING 3-like n=1 Tax=Andrographis paniculata TaxID=175694 RepID=UPI0021E84A3F|nr:protein EARLY FLOWERING 3-like [Andrographis paniculata]
MKRGKDEEKMMGPMFPRLHVKDANKGGPRAPPRNKMALYEQFSIPSQRHNHLSLPRVPTATVPSSTQRGVSERDVFASYKLQSESQYSQYSDISTPSMQVEPRKKLDEDDFRVPIFVQPVPNQEYGVRSNDQDRGKLASKPSCSNEMSKLQNSQMESSTMQEGKLQKKENSKNSSTGFVKVVSNTPALEKAEGRKKQNVLFTNYEPGDKLTGSIDRLETSNSPALCSKAQAANERHDAVVSRENLTTSDKRSSISVAADQSEVRNIHCERSNDTESSENRSCNVKMSDSGVTETSGEDSRSRHDVTPDDVVQVIGQKHFWKARRTIANQQRVLAIQVFELHRLVKVQRLLAASPHLLLEDSTYSGKSTKSSSMKKIPLNLNTEEVSDVSKQKGESDNKQSQKKESSAENAISRNHVPSIQNSTSARNTPAPFTNSGPWCFNQPQGQQQWLIPYMSPTEGLIYKPYPGGCGPPVPNPSMGNFYSLPGGVPALPHPQYQLPPHPGYFPQHGMPVMNVAPFFGSSAEHMNPQSDPDSQNVPTMWTRNEQAPPEEDMEVQASTSSSPVERMQDSQESGLREGRHVLTLFPMSPPRDPATKSEARPPKPRQEAEHPARVIRVVPHNAVSASESAARIFRSIQEERRRYISM